MASYRLIGDCEFDAASGELRRNGTVTRLEPQPAMVLALLAERPGDVVSHEDMRRAVWGDETHVNLQESIHYCVRQVRVALGDQARDPRFVETIPRRGYRLRSDAVVSAAPANARWQRGLAAAGLVAALAVMTAVVEQRPNSHHQIAVGVLKMVHDFVF